MNRQEMVTFVRYVKAMCPAQAIDDFTPDAWRDVVGDLALADCRAAVVQMKRGNNPPAWIDIGQVRMAVRDMRNRRIDEAGPYEPGSGLTELEWRRRAADGQPLPAIAGLKRRDMRAIEGTFK